MYKEKNFRIFAIVAFLYCSFCALIFQPITWQAQGDAGAYIELAKQFLGISTEYIDLSHRQPLYSLLIAPFILIFGEDTFMYPVMWLQFLMIFFSALFVYALFKKLNLFKYLPLLAGIFYLVNFSTLFYGYNILSETLALFIFVAIVYVLLNVSKRDKIFLLMILGLLNGLMVLSRYNAMGVPLVTFVCLLIIHYRNYGFRNFKLLIKPLLVYGISVFVVLNFWMLYNYNQRGFYGIIQKDHPRFTLVINSRIKEDIKVSPEYQSVLEIFLKSREELLEDQKEIFIKKGSLLEHPLFYNLYFFFKGENHVSGLRLYGLAKPELLVYFGLEDTPEGTTKLGRKLKPFYQEIRSQTKRQEIKSRFSALVQTFRPSGTTLPVKDPINLNALPFWMFKIYKILFILINAFVFIYSFFLLVLKIWHIRSYDKWLLLLIMIIILYFPASHFHSITPGDANRFKFPSEPLIIGMFIYYFVYFFLKNKKWIKETIENKDIKKNIKKE